MRWLFRLGAERWDPQGWAARRGAPTPAGTMVPMVLTVPGRRGCGCCSRPRLPDQLVPARRCLRLTLRFGWTSAVRFGDQKRCVDQNNCARFLAMFFLLV